MLDLEIKDYAAVGLIFLYIAGITWTIIWGLDYIPK